MIKLFKYEGYTVSVEPEAVMLTPFKRLWDRDKTKDKRIAQQEFAYIYFMADPRSDYQYIVDEEQRSKEVIQALGMPTKWKPDKHIEAALNYYKSFKPASAGLLEDTKYFVNSFRKELRERSTTLGDLDMKELKEAMSLVKQVPTLAKDLDEAERTLSRDIMQENRARGSQVKSIMEDEV